MPVMYAGFYTIVIALVIFIYQSAVWLHTGVWPYILCNDVIFQFASPKVLKHTWLYEPSGWFGLHTAVTWILAQSLAPVLFIVGVVLMWLASAWSNLNN